MVVKKPKKTFAEEGMPVGDAFPADLPLPDVNNDLTPQETIDMGNDADTGETQNKKGNSVTFNQDNTVTVGGYDASGIYQNVTISKADYDAAVNAQTYANPAVKNKSVQQVLGIQQPTEAQKQAAIAQNTAKALLSSNPVQPLPAIQPENNTEGIINAALAEGAKQAAVGAAGGAALGLVSAGTLSAPGAIVGGIGGFVKGALQGGYEEWKGGKVDEVKKNYRGYTAAKNNMATVINNVNKGLISNADAVKQFRLYQEQVYQVDALMKAYYNNNPESWVVDGIDQRAKIQGTIRNFPAMEQALQNAMATRNPLNPVVSFYDPEDYAAAAAENQ